MKSKNGMGTISIADIKPSDVFWECESGQDECFVAITGAIREGQGYGLYARSLMDRERTHFFEADRSGQGRLCLYDSPQYTRQTNWPVLLDNLAAILQGEASEVAMQAMEREKGLSLAATQYSESRDKWMQEAKAKQEEIDALKEVIAEMADIASQKLNGITMGERIRHVLMRSAGIEV